MPWKKKPVYRTIWDEYESEKKAEEERERQAHMTLFELQQEHSEKDKRKLLIVTAVVALLVLAFIVAGIVTGVRSRGQVFREMPKTNYPSAWKRGGEEEG